MVSQSSHVVSVSSWPELAAQAAARPVAGPSMSAVIAPVVAVMPSPSQSVGALTSTVRNAPIASV